MTEFRGDSLRPRFMFTSALIIALDQIFLADNISQANVSNWVGQMGYVALIVAHLSNI